MSSPQYYAPSFPAQPAVPPPYGGLPGAVDATGVVAIDLACRKCSYNLRGLPASGRCPECGTPVGLSVQGDYLRYSDPNWVLTLRRGVNLILAGIGVLILAVVVSIAVTMSQMMAAQNLLLVRGIALVGNVMVVAGGWFLTTPDPSGVGEDKYGTSRKVIRVALGVGIVNDFLNLAGSAAVFPPAVSDVITIVAFAAALTGLVGQFAQLRYLSKLATRIPDDKLCRRAAFLTWAIVISYGALVLLGVLAALFARGVAGGMARGSGGRGGMAAFGCLGGIDGLCLLIFGIMYLLMLEKFAKRFKEQAEYARQTWAASAG